MSMPNVPGFTNRPESLADDWQKPSGEFDAELWPADLLQSMARYPAEWIVVEQYDGSTGSGSTSISTFLTTMMGWEQASQSHSWSARYLGDYLFDEDPERDVDGLYEDLRDEPESAEAQFLVAVRHNHRLYPITVDLSYPLQWFWDALRNGNNWSYLDLAGNEHPLVRTTVTGESYQVEIRALELRRYLERRGLVAVVQYDHVTYADSAAFRSFSEEFANSWASFVWAPAHERIGPGRNSFSRLLGKRVVTGATSGPNPMSLDWDNPAGKEYPQFVYAVDVQSGKQRSFTSDPDSLANYFGKNPDAPHYLTPVYFDARVLNRYRDEPSKYEVTSTRLSCLGLWGISIGESTTGLIEVYLGDLGRDLPWQEWPHWKTHNVVPSGRMAEDRFRRDFLAQWAGAPTSLEAMRDSLSELREASQRVLGWPLIRELDGSNLLEFNSLRLPTTNEARELLIPVLTLAKAFVDAVDERALRAHLELHDTSERSLSLLEKLVASLGGDIELVKPFRTLYKLRSSGGLAHWGGSEVAKTIEKLGLAGMTPSEVVEFLATGLDKSCRAMTLLLEPATK